MSLDEDLHLNLPKDIKYESVEFEIIYNNNLDNKEKYSDYCVGNESYKIGENEFLFSNGFVCWNTSKDGLGKDFLVNEEVIINQDLVLYAVWKSNKPEVQTIYEADYMITGFGVPNSEIKIFYPRGSVVDVSVNDSGSWICIIPSFESPIVKYSEIKIIQIEKNMQQSDSVVVKVLPNIKSQ